MTIGKMHPCLEEKMIWNTFVRVEKRKHVSLMGDPYTTCSVLFSNWDNAFWLVARWPESDHSKVAKWWKTEITNLKAVFSFGRKFSLHQTLYWSSNNRRVWLQIWHHPWYYFGWVTQRSSTMQLHWYGQDWAICIRNILHICYKHIRKISSMKKMWQSVCSEVCFWYRWFCLRYLQATLSKSWFFCKVWFRRCFCRDFRTESRKMLK